MIDSSLNILVDELEHGEDVVNFTTRNYFQTLWPGHARVMALKWDAKEFIGKFLEINKKNGASTGE